MIEAAALSFRNGSESLWSVPQNSIIGSMKVKMNIEVLPSDFVFHTTVGGWRECNPMQS